jgi:hypothetical protein
MDNNGQEFQSDIQSTEQTQTSQEQASSQQSTLNDAHSSEQASYNSQELYGEYANTKSIQKFKSPQDLAKSYINLEKLLGKNRIPIPEKPEDYETVYKTLGKPETPDEYQLPQEVIDLYQGSEQELNKIKEMMHSADILPQQAEKLLSIYAQEESQRLQQIYSSLEAKKNEATQKLQNEWGDRFDENMQRAAAVYSHFDDDIKQVIDNSGLGADDRFVKFLSYVGNFMTEGDNLVDSQAAYQVQAENAQRELDMILNDKTHPYWNQHAGKQHTEAVKQVQELYRILEKSAP